MTVKILFMLLASALLSTEAKQQTLQDENSSLSVTITSATLNMKGLLRCNWKLRNKGKDTVHVYSSYLRGSGVGVVGANEGQIFLVLTTWLSKQRNTYPAYDFPKPTFITLDPGNEISGTLERADFTHKLPAHVQIALVVGYVTDFVQFRKDMEDSLKQGTEFQANSIVRWQNVQYSAPIALSRR